MHCADGAFSDGILKGVSMSSSISLSIKMFGAFRQYYPDMLVVEVAEGSTAADVKASIAARLRALNPAFKDDDLIAKSALANNQRVFKEQDCIINAEPLAILPPVCGG